MIYSLTFHKQSRKDIAKMKRSGWDMKKLTVALEVIRNGPPFPPHYHVHELHGSLEGVFDMHISQNWLILFAFTSKNEIRILRTGTHASINLTE